MSVSLADFSKSRDFLVCIDSDGCVFDNMELKHKECFCLATVNVWGCRMYPVMRVSLPNLLIYTLKDSRIQPFSRIGSYPGTLGGTERGAGTGICLSQPDTAEKVD